MPPAVSNNEIVRCVTIKDVKIMRLHAHSKLNACTTLGQTLKKRHRLLRTRVTGQAKNKWDEARGKGKRKSKESVRMPKAPKKGTAAAPAAWEDGVTYLPPKSELPTLKNRAATVAAESINRAPEVRHVIGSSQARRVLAVNGPAEELFAEAMQAREG